MLSSWQPPLRQFAQASRAVLSLYSKSSLPSTETNRSSIPSVETTVPYPNPRDAPQSIWGKIGFEEDLKTESFGEYALARVDDVFNLVTKNSLWYIISSAYITSKIDNRIIKIIKFSHLGL